MKWTGDASANHERLIGLLLSKEIRAVRLYVRERCQLLIEHCLIVMAELNYRRLIAADASEGCCEDQNPFKRISAYLRNIHIPHASQFTLTTTMMTFFLKSCWQREIEDFTGEKILRSIWTFQFLIILKTSSEIIVVGRKENTWEESESEVKVS